MQQCLLANIPKLFPDYETVWDRFEGDLDVAPLENEEKEQDTKTTNDEKEGKEEEEKKEKKDKLIQAVDTACAGTVFLRFRVNVKPTDFVQRLFKDLLQDKSEAPPLRFCAVRRKKVGHSELFFNLLLSSIALAPFGLHLSCSKRPHDRVLRAPGAPRRGPEKGRYQNRDCH